MRAVYAVTHARSWPRAPSNKFANCNGTIPQKTLRKPKNQDKGAPHRRETKPAIEALKPSPTRGNFAPPSVAGHWNFTYSDL